VCFARGELARLCIAIACGGSLLFCLTVSVGLHKSPRSTASGVHPGKILKGALPDETREGESFSLGTGAPPVIHAILHVRGGESVVVPQATPIPSVLYTRPATDRAPPLS
jgi:hypothetical protein